MMYTLLQLFLYLWLGADFLKQLEVDCTHTDPSIINWAVYNTRICMCTIYFSWYYYHYNNVVLSQLEQSCTITYIDNGQVFVSLL